jgi:hypothetical protein
MGRLGSKLVRTVDWSQQKSSRHVKIQMPLILASKNAIYLAVQFASIKMDYAVVHGNIAMSSTVFINRNYSDCPLTHKSRTKAQSLQV